MINSIQSLQVPPESNDAVNTNTSESTEPAEVDTEAEAQEKKGGDNEVGVAAENVPLAVVEDGEADATEAATDANSEAAAPSCGAEISEVKAQGEEEEREAAVGEGGESEYAKRMASDLCVQSRKARWANRKAASKKAAAAVRPETAARPESPRPTSQNEEVASRAASAQALSEDFIERKLYSAVCKSPEPVAAAAPEEATAAEEPEEQPQSQGQSQQKQPPPPHFNGKARRRGNRGKNAVQRQNSRSEPEAAVKGAAPLVDEDGWETKSNKRKGRKGGNSSRQNSIVGNGVAQQQQLRQRRQSSLEARDEEAACDHATEGTPVSVADEASVPSTAEEAPSEAAGEQPQEPEAARPEKEREEREEKERDGDGEESVKSEEATLQRRKKRNKKAYRQGTQPLELEQQHECCVLPRVYVQDGMPGTVGPLNTKVRPATELFDAATLTEVMQRRGGHLDTLFVQGIGCGIGVGPLTMGRIGGRGRYCPPDRAHEIPEKFREQPKEEGEDGEGGCDSDKGKEGEEEKEEKRQRGEQEPEQPEEGLQPAEGQPPSVEIELD